MTVNFAKEAMDFVNTLDQHKGEVDTHLAYKHVIKELSEGLINGSYAGNMDAGDKGRSR